MRGAYGIPNGIGKDSRTDVQLNRKSTGETKNEALRVSADLFVKLVLITAHRGAANGSG
jgi:hypothetical protein